MTPANSPERGPVHEARLIARIAGLLTNLEALSLSRAAATSRGRSTDSHIDSAIRDSARG